jgi:hypothetical protein
LLPADTTNASTSKVNPSPLLAEELAHPVDISVSSKYGTNLAHLTHVLVEDVRLTLDSFR